MKPSAAEDRCVPDVDASEESVAANNGEQEGEAPRPNSRKDAGQAAPTDVGEPVMVEDAGQADAGGIDTNMDAGEKDAGTSDTGAPVPACGYEDFAAWQAFHLSDQLVAQIVACSKKLGCTSGKPCALDRCLREASGVAACESCTRDEVACVSNNCQKSCSVSDQECRACACAAGCIEQFESCAERSLQVCSSCEAVAGQCGGDLSPELIMVVVSPLVL